MNMIKSLRLQNFKPFQNQLLEFKPITLLSGLNSSGKSSVLQALVLLRQSYQQGLLFGKNQGLALKGDLVCIGTAKDALFEGAKDDNIGFELIWEDGMEGIWKFKYNRTVDVLQSIESVSKEVFKSSLFDNNFHYLQAERLGPRPFSEMSHYQVRQLQQIGTRGEYTVHFLAINELESIPNKKLSHPKVKIKKSTPNEDEKPEPSNALIDQVEAWLGEISPGTRLKIDSLTNIDLMNIQYFYGDNNPYRSTNVGFGITYTLPILVAVLFSKPGTLILIENPEAHLHPKGQAKMGELLALAASCGVQIVIETHSDHLLNGIRLAVHGGKLKPQDVQLHFFQKDQQGQIEVISPKMDRNGRIDKWPDDFFDTWDKILEVLLEPAVEEE